MERTYREIELPGGTFRMYDDTPYVWVQVLKEGELSLVEQIEKNFNAGEISGKLKK